MAGLLNWDDDIIWWNRAKEGGILGSTFLQTIPAFMSLCAGTHVLDTIAENMLQRTATEPK
jgi:hypothetical protein